jgi:hypothetical protein
MVWPDWERRLGDGAVPWPGGKRETLFEDQHYRPMDSVATFLCNDRVVMCTVDP